MRIESLTNLGKNKVGVRPEDIVFAEGCAVCQHSPAQSVEIRFSTTAFWLLIAGIESIVINLPLCRAHRDKHENRSRIINTIQRVCIVLALLCGGSIYFTLDANNDTLQSVLIALFALLLLTLHLSIWFRGRTLPLRVKPRNFDRLGKYGAYVFTFFDHQASKRFHDVNLPEKH
ncbi:MAG: hypothetical protein AB7F75_07295 [Planctomycetota bacterium]